MGLCSCQSALPKLRRTNGGSRSEGTLDDVKCLILLGKAYPVCVSVLALANGGLQVIFDTHLVNQADLGFGKVDALFDFFQQLIE